MSFSHISNIYILKKHFKTPMGKNEGASFNNKILYSI